MLLLKISQMKIFYLHF